MIQEELAVGSSKVPRSGLDVHCHKGSHRQRSSHCFLLSLTTSMPGMNILTCDTTKVYIQSTCNIERRVYIWPPMQIGVPPNLVLEVGSPLNGTPEWSLHW